MVLLRPASVVVLLALFLSGASLPRASSAVVQARIDRDQQLGKPVVAHVIVALCDNENQGIVPVPASFGNGQDPRANLYWGALYGVRTHLLRSGYHLVRNDHLPRDGVLERVVLTKVVAHSGKPLSLYLVAEAWDGRLINQAIQRFLELAPGKHVEAIAVDVGTQSSGVTIEAGGAAAVIAFVGHNGLMDFTLPSTSQAESTAPPRGSIVLACASRPYFLRPLREGGSHPLLLTTGLMAPEAYTLDAALTALIRGADSRAIHESAAQAYHAYQKCGLRGARSLFHVE